MLRLKAPVLAGVDAPGHVLLPSRSLPIAFEVMGTGSVTKGSHTISATLEEPGRGVRAQGRQDLMSSPWLALPLPSIEPGSYTLRLVIRDAEGKTCSDLTQPLTAYAGPL